MDRRAWKATVHRITKSWTQLSMHADISYKWNDTVFVFFVTDAIVNRIAFLIPFQIVHCSCIEMQLIFVLIFISKNFAEFVHRS